MTKAEEYIKNIIKRDGPISFKDFMNFALYATDIGYYNREDTKIGRSGDFYTSSSLHRAFSAILALQTEELWQILGHPNRFVFLEFGAGMGYFANDFLDYINGKPLFHHIEYFIVEINPYLRRCQQDILSRYVDKIKWFHTISDIEPFTGVVFSNELLDAFAVHLIEIKDSIPYEIWIDCEDDTFKEIFTHCTKEIDDYIKDYLPHLIDEKNKVDCFRTEINLDIKDWLLSVSERLKEGFIITIDYGYSADEYYAIERNRGTLLCYHKHNVDENPYEHIGEKDITAHVNFSSLVRWAEGMGIKTCGFTTQGSYIVAMGIDRVIAELLGNNPDAFELAKIKGLFMPDGFGSSHKVLIQYKGLRDFTLKGFSMRNSLQSLIHSHNCSIKYFNSG